MRMALLATMAIVLASTAAEASAEYLYRHKGALGIVKTTNAGPNTAPVWSPATALGAVRPNTPIAPITLAAATDANGDALTYSVVSGLPAGLSFDAATRTLSGTPTTPGAHTPVLRVSDGIANTDVTFSMTVQSFVAARMTGARAAAWSLVNDWEATSQVSSYGSILSNVGVSSGKWYWEYRYVNGTVSTYIDGCFGIAGSSVALSDSIGSSPIGWCIYPDHDPSGTTGALRNNATSVKLVTPVLIGDVVSVALDMDAGKVWMAVNGVWQNGNPATGVNDTPAFTSGIAGRTIHAAVGDGSTMYYTQFRANFGQAAFAHTPPAGFYPGLGTFQ